MLEVIMDFLSNYFISYNNIVLLIFTVSIVAVLDNKKTTNKYINYLATSTLVIYLLTDNSVVRKPLNTCLIKEILMEYMDIFIS